MVKKLLPMFIIAIAGCSTVATSETENLEGSAVANDSIKSLGTVSNDSFSMDSVSTSSVYGDIVSKFKSDLIKSELYFSWDDGDGIPNVREVPTTLLRYTDFVYDYHIQLVAMESNNNTPGLEPQTYFFSIVDQHQQMKPMETGYATISFEAAGKDSEGNEMVRLTLSQQNSGLIANKTYFILHKNYSINSDEYLAHTQVGNKDSVADSSNPYYNPLITVSKKISLLTNK